MSASAASGSEAPVRRAFGTTAGGETVDCVEIGGGGLSARILTLGACVQDLRLAGHAPSLVLGFDTPEAYARNPYFFGAIVGRVANRIAGGRLTLDGERYQLDRNDGESCLHGGAGGLHARNWSVEAAGTDFVRLAITEPSGHMGFPGTLSVACTYTVKPRGTLCVEIEAVTDRLTVCSLAHHSYFNLEDGGRGPVGGHKARFAASAYLPVDDMLIPTGVVEPVEGSPFDFHVPRAIGEGGIGYDHNFCLRAARGPLAFAAWVQGPDSGVEMELWTTEPGLQFFDGRYGEIVDDGLDGIRYGSGAGFCLEPQIWPDAPNRPYFPQADLRPGETYRQTSEYRFRLPQEI